MSDILARDASSSVPLSPLAATAASAGLLPIGLTLLGGVEVGGKLFFVRSTPETGDEIWVTDGTLKGTHLVKDITPGPEGSDLPEYMFAAFGDRLSFDYFNPMGFHQRWISDGKATGTFPIDSPLSDVSEVGTLGSLTIFRLSGDYPAQPEMWVTDGTSRGTHKLADAWGPTPYQAGAAKIVDGKMVFVGQDVDGTAALWSTDGTTAGTHLLKDVGLDARGQLGHATVVNGKLYFSAPTDAGGAALWVTDGTAGGTTMVEVISTTSSFTGVLGGAADAPFSVLPDGKILFFTAGATGPSVSDGTAAGTFILKDLAGGAGTAPATWAEPVGGKFFFTWTDGLPWITDGTSEGTIRLSDVPIDTLGWMDRTWVMGDKVLFRSRDAQGNAGLMVTDGTVAGTLLIKPGDRGNISQVLKLETLDDRAVFICDNGSNTAGIWVTDGTVAGTKLVETVRLEGYEGFNADLTRMGDLVYFIGYAPSGQGGKTLYASDGTVAGTHAVTADIPGLKGAEILDLSVHRGTLVFTVNDGVHGQETWTSDGTVAGTQRVTNDALPGGAATAGPDVIAGGVGVDILDGRAGDDVLVGQDGADVLRGGEGNDTLMGGAGNDSLDGGVGADRMSGDAGNDTYYVDDAGDVIMERAGEGTDQVFSSVSFTLAANVENLTLTGLADLNGFGNDLANILRGNTGSNQLDGGDGNDQLYGEFGQDILNGGAGDDILYGGQGADQMTGGVGNDTYYVDSLYDSVIELAGEGVDLVISSTPFLELQANVENLTIVAGTADFGGAGNALNNVMRGNDGANQLSGQGGDDLVYGGGGNDVISGEDGADRLNGDAGDDSIDGGAGDDILLGGLGSDRLYGGLGADLLNGGAGADLMAGGGGDDSYIVDDAGDVISEAEDAGLDRVTSSISYTLSANVEHLTLTGTANLNGTGNASNNLLRGNAGNNILDGQDGADSLFGGAGDDTLFGGAGNDTLDGGEGADIMTGGSGNDLYVVDNAKDRVIELADGGIDTVRASLSWVLGDNVENLILTEGAAAARNATGNGLDNSLTGNSAANVLDGGAGADILRGLGGADIYIVDNAGDRVIEAVDGGIDTVKASVSFGLGANVENLILTGAEAINGTGNVLANVITGNGGNNRLDGGAGNDLINGGAGDDVIIGGAGNDTLYGGAGADTFVITKASIGGATVETDTIKDFSAAEGDIIDLSGIDANSLVKGDQAFTLVGAFSKAAGQMTLAYAEASDITTLRLDVDGDGKYDYQLRINGHVTDTAGWLL